MAARSSSVQVLLDVLAALLRFVESFASAIPFVLSLSRRCGSADGARLVDEALQNLPTRPAIRFFNPARLNGRRRPREGE
jgi:hypothetical protein